MKLAETGLGCLSIPDVFHLIHELVKSYSLAILGRLRHARQALSQAQERLHMCQVSDPNGAETPQVKNPAASGGAFRAGGHYADIARFASTCP